MTIGHGKMMTLIMDGDIMRKCVRNGNIFAFSMGLLVSYILPQGWLVVVVAVILAVTAAVASHCYRC